MESDSDLFESDSCIFEYDHNSYVDHSRIKGVTDYYNIIDT